MEFTQKHEQTLNNKLKNDNLDLLLTIGVGLPFLGFVFRFVISEKGEI